MSSDLQSSLELDFQGQLLKRVNAVRQHTRIGVRRILEDIQRNGGIQTAKARLFALFVHADDFFQATERIGRLDLSIEALALETKWKALFTENERDLAARRLLEHGFDPTSERRSASDVPTELATFESPFSQMHLHRSERLNFAEFVSREGEMSLCERTSACSAALRQGSRPVVSSLIRKHLDDCLHCRKRHSDLLAAYSRFDREALGVWVEFLNTFRTSLNVEEEDLNRFLPWGPEDFEGPDHDEDFEVMREVEIENSIRPSFSWRAVRLGCYLGRLMLSFARTFDEPGDLWVKWRNGQLPGPVSDFIRSVERDLFILGLAAKNLLSVRDWSRDEDGVLWLPTDGDLKSVPGVLMVELTEDLDDWQEVLGELPQGLNVGGILYLAAKAAEAEMSEIETGTSEPTPGLLVREQLDRIEAATLAHQASLDDLRTKQDAAIDQLQRMVLYMSSTDRFACESALHDELGGIYEKLVPEARCLLLASSQIYRTQGIAAPALIVQALAAAFEVQARSTLLPTILDYLKSKGLKKLMPDAAWLDTDRTRPIYSPDRKAEKFTLGEMERLLRHPEPAIDEVLVLLRLNRHEVHGAFTAVQDARNDAAHGRSIDIGTAEAIRADWLNWGGRPGGIFGAIFKGD